MTDTLEGAPPEAPSEPAPPTIENQCDECGEVKKSKAALLSHKRAKHGMAVRDKTPASVTVNLGPRGRQTKDAALDAVEKRAAQMVQTIAAVVMLAGQPLDAVDLQAASEPWAKSVRELAVYEEWIKKLAAGGDQPGRVTAWVQFALATLAMLMPILIRHKALPENIAQVAAMAFAAAQAESTDGPPVDAQPAAA